jgi:ferrous-iron efflux pump FieF
MAMLGSLADSALDLVASIVVLLGIRVAAMPADSDHRFGHGKAEALASLVQVIVITISALFIGYTSIHRLIDGAQTGNAELGIAVSLAAMASTIALWLVRSAWMSSSNALDQLMDREWPDELRDKFLAAAREYPELAGLHDFRTRTSGTHHFAQFHVWVPADWTVRQAHDRLDRAEQALRERFPGTEILIHVDPEGQVDGETLLPLEITEKAG